MNRPVRAPGLLAEVSFRHRILTEYATRYHAKATCLGTFKAVPGDGRKSTMPQLVWPRSGPTRIAVGETHGRDPKICSTPAGSHVFLTRYHGLPPTAIHVLSLRDNRGQCRAAPPGRRHRSAFDLRKRGAVFRCSLSSSHFGQAGSEEPAKAGTPNGVGWHMALFGVPPSGGRGPK
jgi:hypothetical protein